MPLKQFKSYIFSSCFDLS